MGIADISLALSSLSLGLLLNPSIMCSESQTLTETVSNNVAIMCLMALRKNP